VAAGWTDLVDPDRKELLHNVAIALDPEAVEILVSGPGDGRDARPLVESHGTYVLTVLAHPIAHTGDDRVEYHEIDVVATPDAVLTVRKTSRDGGRAPIDSLAARMEEQPSAGAVVHAIVDGVADAFLDLLDGLYEEIDELEENVDVLQPGTLRRRMAELRHELLHARRTSSATRAAVRRIVDGRVDVASGMLFPPSVEEMFVDTYETLVRVTEELDVARDLLAGVRDYTQAKVAEGQNEVAKKLTVIASLVLVPSLIVGFFGQNFAGEFNRGWWTLGVSTALILATTLVQLALFRWRRWI
jgi:magnesium transporter